MRKRFTKTLQMLLFSAALMIPFALSARVVESGAYRHARGETDVCHAEKLARDLAKVAAKNDADKICMDRRFFGVANEEFSVTSTHCNSCMNSSGEVRCIVHAEFKCFKLGK